MLEEATNHAKKDVPQVVIDEVKGSDESTLMINCNSCVTPRPAPIQVLIILWKHNKKLI